MEARYSEVSSYFFLERGKGGLCVLCQSHKNPVVNNASCQFTMLKSYLLSTNILRGSTIYDNGHAKQGAITLHDCETLNLIIDHTEILSENLSIYQVVDLKPLHALSIDVIKIDLHF